MNKVLNKRINIEITKECWKVLKMLSIEKEKTLQEVVSEILERETVKRSTRESARESMKEVKDKG